MFELSVARKYLLPRWRQLSVSLISLISILVIALVVWLIVVFFSVTDGLEKMWTQKLIALTAPVRVTPTEDYFASYYYQVDNISNSSGYSHKSIGEKLSSENSDPYDPTSDEEIPLTWPSPDRSTDGTLKDPVKFAFASVKEIKGIPDITARDFELAISQIRLRLIRQENEKQNAGLPPYSQETQSFLTHQTYLGSFDPNNPSISQSLIPLTLEDTANLLQLLSYSAENDQQDSPNETAPISQTLFQQRLNTLLESMTITQLKTPSQGWIMPRNLLPTNGRFNVLLVLRADKVAQLYLPVNLNDLSDLKTNIEKNNLTVIEGHLRTNNGEIFIEKDQGAEEPLRAKVPIIIPKGLNLSAKVASANLRKATVANQIPFQVSFSLQGQHFGGEIPMGALELSQVDWKTNFEDSPEILPPWIIHTSKGYQLPGNLSTGEGVLLPKSFREGGVLVGDRGYLSYYIPTASSLQEQRIQVYVAGFYDPGIIPLGGKYILANSTVTSIVRSSPMQEQSPLSNGINIRFSDLSKAEAVKTHLIQSFKNKGIDKYWKVETYREYEYTKDLIQQLQSEKNLYSVIALVIIIVACSNIISMLIILVNDKKQEIGILRSMGANSASIASIFGLCGTIMGLLGSTIGILAAMVTLANLNTLVDLIGRLQGYDMFNAAFYGESLPSELSYEALTFVLGATVVISLLAGIVPAVKASLLRPSSILRSE